MVQESDADPSDLLARHAAQIGRLVRRLVAESDADDLEQELRVAALERPPQNRVALPAWIATTLRNLVAKSWRGRARRAAREAAVARPEPLPSTDELVARVELEEFLLRCVRELPEPERVVVLLRFFEERSAAEIAAQLGLGVSSVRARLARALVRLRERLDQKSGGDRGQWVAALAPAATKFATASAVGAVSGSAAIGVFAMSSKVAAAVVVAFAVTATVWFVTAAHRAATRHDVALERGDPPSTQLKDRPSFAPSPSIPEPVRAAEVVPPRDEPVVAPPESGGVGRLQFAVIDGATLQRLELVTVRAMSGTRFARMQGGGRFDLALTKGEYDLAVTVPGYEPELRRAVDVKAGGVNDLGTIALGRGSASITGRVRSRSLAPDVRRYVELRGDGRSPCPLCTESRPGPDPAASADLRVEEARLKKKVGGATLEETVTLLRKRREAEVVFSHCCGYDDNRSMVEVDESGRFEFTGLAAGTYFLRALDATPRPQPTLRLELGMGERRDVELVLEPEVALEVDLLDDQDRRFVGRWRDDWTEHAEPILLVLDIDGVLIKTLTKTSKEEVRAQLGPPSRIGELPGEKAPPAAKVAGSEAEQVAVDLDSVLALLPKVIGEPCADRPRTDSDALFPAIAIPGFAGVEYGIELQSPGIFVLTRMPSSRVRVSAECGGFKSAVIEVDLDDPAQRRVKLVLTKSP